jgi:hypothetical protein
MSHPPEAVIFNAQEHLSHVVPPPSEVHQGVPATPFRRLDRSALGRRSAAVPRHGVPNPAACPLDSSEWFSNRTTTM